MAFAPQTLTLRADTVTFTAFRGGMVVSVPNSGVNRPFDLVQVGKVTFAAVGVVVRDDQVLDLPAFLPPLVPAPMRETAKMPAPSAA